MEIIELSQRQDLLEEAVQYFWKCWGSESNFKFYEDCISHSLDSANKLPKFYIGLLNNEICASYALLVNDINSRQDLVPWFACLFVNPEHRNKSYAETLLQHGLNQAKTKGFDNLYLSSDLENFYERKGWDYLCQTYGVSGGDIKVYTRATA